MSDGPATARADHPLDPIFRPRSIAIVGVPREVRSPRGGGFLLALLDQGFHEHKPLYPVNPNADEIGGLPCYPSLLDAPGPVDHVISSVPARAVEQLVGQAIEKGVRSLHFFTAGFAESGDPGLASLQDRVIARATGAGIRVIGPNCMGLYVPGERIAFQGGFPTEPGNVMAISQSGGNAMEIVFGLAQRGVRFSKLVSFGNGADVDAPELFDYAAADPATEVVIAYLEGTDSGRALFGAVRRCARVKPTIILKGGLTAAGARAAHSHTGSLAGSREVFEALCRQTGAALAGTMAELHDLVVGVTTGARRVRGPRAMMVGGGGGFSVLAADAMLVRGQPRALRGRAARARLRADPRRPPPPGENLPRDHRPRRQGRRLADAHPPRCPLLRRQSALQDQRRHSVPPPRRQGCPRARLLRPHLA